MVKITRSDGKEFKFGDIFKITKLEGVGNVAVETNTQKKAFGNGDIIIGRRIPSRVINIFSECYSRELNLISRQIVQRFFNPSYTFKCYVTYKNIERWIPCELDLVDLPTDNAYSGQLFNLSLFCADPFFRSVSEFGKNIAEITPMFGYPWFAPIGKGFTYGLYNFANKVFIDNDGDVETFCKAIVKIKGTVEDFKIVKNESEFIEITGNLKKSDELVIDFINARVTLNGEIINNRLNRRSKYFSIDLGGSDIQYSAKTGSNVVEVYIFYNKMYLGV